MDNEKDTGGLVPPPPQTPEIKLRTAESDVKSMRESGGGSPTPEFIKPKDVASGPVFKPETMPQRVEDLSVAGEKKTGAWLWIVLALVVLVFVGVAGYLYVWPMFQPAIEEPSPEMVTEPTPQPEGMMEKPSHISAFGSNADLLPKVTLADYNAISILTVLQNEAFRESVTNDLREVAVEDSKGQALFSSYLAALMPELVTTDLETTLKAVFEDDFTAYLYYDDKGIWPGYIVRTRPNVDIDIVSLNEALKNFESSSYNNLFLSPPGTTQSFRTGQVKEKFSNRFAPFSEPGASFNYGLFDQYLIINTSYSGLLKTLEKLGL